MTNLTGCSSLIISFQKRVSKLKKFNEQIWKKRIAKRQQSNDKKRKAGEMEENIAPIQNNETPRVVSIFCY